MCPLIIGPICPTFAEDAHFDIDELYLKYGEMIDEMFPAIIAEQKTNILRRETRNDFLARVHLYSPLKKLKNKYYDTAVVGIKKAKKKRIKDMNNYADFKKYLDELPPQVVADRTARTFINNCQLNFGTDSEILEACGSECFIKMEEMTKSPEYFNKNVYWKIMKVDADESYLKSVFEENDHINTHSFELKTSDEIYKSWPESFRKYFWESLNSHSTKKLYQDLQYEIPGNI